MVDTIKITSDIEQWRPNDANNITFVLTEDCQLRCKYCYICGKNSFTRMTFDTAKKAVDYVLEHREIYSHPAVVWDFIGGEPFLEVDLIDKICDYLKTRTFEMKHPWFENYRFSFSTNGLMYNNPRVQEYIKKNKEHLSIGISIDGTKQKHDLNRVFPDGSGSYDAIVQNLPLWLEQFPSSTKATIAHDDLSMVKDSVLHLWNLGIKEIAMNCIFEDVWQDGDDDIFERQLIELADEIIDKGLYKDCKCTLFERFLGFPMDPEKENQNWCGAGRMLAIDTQGQFHPCLRFVQYSLSNKHGWVTGNAEVGLDTNRIRPFLALDRLVQSPQECIDCEVASGCAWCQGNNYDSADTETVYQRSTYLCKMHKARVRANNYLWNRLDKIVPPSEGDERVRRLALRKGLQYLIVIMDSTAPSFCYYTGETELSCTMPDETLRKIVYYALTENLTLNLILGEQPLTDTQREILKDVNYMIFRSAATSIEAGQNTVDVFDFESDVWDESRQNSEILILRLDRANLAQLPQWLAEHSLSARRISLTIKNLDTFTEDDIQTYQRVLTEIQSWLPQREEEKPLELSILTDRIQLTEPNHCDAGVKHVTVAPDGRFYLCPGFYYDELNADPNDKYHVSQVITDLDTVLKTHELPIKNRQLLQLDHAPICRICDAWQCKRCVWMNKRSTLEVNTPSRQQCVCAHLERNASRDLIEPLFLTDMVQIPEIDYLDPFEKLMESKNPKMKQGGKTDEC